MSFKSSDMATCEVGLCEAQEQFWLIAVLNSTNQHVADSRTWTLIHWLNVQCLYR